MRLGSKTKTVALGPFAVRESTVKQLIEPLGTVSAFCPDFHPCVSLFSGQGKSPRARFLHPMRNSQRTQRLIANFRALLRDDDVGGLDQTPNVRYEIIALALMAVVGVALIFMFPGSPEQDTDYHFLMARTAWLDHSYFVNVWGRPLFTTTFAPAALIGYTAARFFTLAISLTTAWQTCRLAIDLRIARAWVVIPVLIGQPTFFALFTDVYTEPLFALVFVLALRLHFSGRIKLGMFVASLLPLARPEGVFLCLCWGLWVLTQPKTTSLKTSFARRLINRLASTLILAIGVVCWWLAALIITGDPLFILHNWPWGFHSAFVHGSLFDYARRGVEFAGLLLVYPFIVGLWLRLRSRAWLPITSSVFFGALFITLRIHSLWTVWGGRLCKIYGCRCTGDRAPDPSRLECFCFYPNLLPARWRYRLCALDSFLFKECLVR